MRANYGMTLTAILLIAGCGSGQQGSAEAPSASLNKNRIWNIEGIWKGTITPNVSGESQDVVALADGNNGMHLLSRYSQYFGPLSGTISSPDEADIDTDLTGVAAVGHRLPDGSVNGQK